VEWLKPLSITETAAVKRHCTSFTTASASMKSSPEVPACSLRLVRPQSRHSVAQSAGSHVAIRKIDIMYAWLKWATRPCHGVVAS
jgi:hypothetical protein